MYQTIHVQSIHIPELSLYHELHENQLARFFEPKPGLFIAESAKVIGRALDAGYEAYSVLMEESFFGPAGPAAPLRDLLAQLPENTPVYTAPKDVLTQITGYHLTGGILCAMKRKAPADPAAILAQLCGAEISGHKKRLALAVLDEINNPTNIGAIFRNAAGLGMDAVLLTHGCSDPLYRRSIRVSMGTVFQVPWACWPKQGSGAAGLADFLRQEGFLVASMALARDSVPISHPRFRKADRLAVVLGNEERGISPAILDRSDLTVRIPMHHGVDSLNVAAASALAFWAAAQRADEGC